jgi:uncharacterized protein
VGGPTRALDVDELLAEGWRPIPFREFVVKLASRCNLACDYCYVYEMADQSWQSTPMVMAEETIAQLGRRISEHATRHGTESLRVVLHGGEPLLAGAARIRHAAAGLRAAVPAGTRLELGIQTNGVLLDEELLGVLGEHRIRVGVSIDGDAASHDRHRRHRDGRGSFAGTAKALRLLAQPAHRELYSGLLCTIDLANDPVGVYEALLDFAPPAVDFLLPHGNWETPPPGLPALTLPGPAVHGSATPYGDWLVAIFDRWYAAPRQETHVRLFEEIINLLLGGASRSEQVGLSPVALIVVDTDGSLQQVDTLKSSYAGAPYTGLNIFDHPLDAALHHPSVVTRQLGLRALGEQCRGCRIVRVCGGGHYAHRYRPGEGFTSPSVYCLDLQRLIDHIGQRLRSDLARVSAKNSPATDVEDSSPAPTYQ